MAKRRRGHRKTRHSRRSRKQKRKVIGFIKAKGKYRLVTGIKGKRNTYRLAGKGFKTKKALARHFVKKYRRR